MALYRLIVDIHAAFSTLLAPILCVFVWMLVGKARARSLHAQVRWLLLSAISGTLTAVAILMIEFVRYFDRFDYGLASLSYPLNIIGMFFSIAAFVRLWRVIAVMPPDPSGPPPPAVPPSADPPPPSGIWPPAPRS